MQNSTSIHRVVVCGARRRRQGIGAFIASQLQQQGAEVVGVVGTSEETAEQARMQLLASGIHCRAYTSLTIAMAREQPTLVVLATPYVLHQQELAIVSDCGCHCLCEKPLWWDENNDRVARTQEIVRCFREKRRALALVTQWPYTLPTFYALYPQLADVVPDRFEMALTPISQGPEMVLDSAPHVISMLQRLVGCGEVQKLHCRYHNPDYSALELDFVFRHRRGQTHTICRFANLDVRPRPAAYSINGSTALRGISLPSYEMQLRSSSQTLPMPDPLALLIADFLRRLGEWEKYAAEEAAIVVNSIAALEPLVEAARLAM